MTAALKPHEVLGQRLRAQTAEALAATHRPEVLARAAAQAMEAAECAFAELQEDASVARKVAGLDCRKYCAACCYKTVSVTPPRCFTWRITYGGPSLPRPCAISGRGCAGSTKRFGA